MNAPANGSVGLLQWSSAEGRPSYLLGDGIGYVSRVADTIEGVQLGMAADLLGHAADMLGDREATAPQMHFLAGRLAESLRRRPPDRGKPWRPPPAAAVGGRRHRRPSGLTAGPGPAVPAMGATGPIGHEAALRSESGLRHRAGARVRDYPVVPKVTR